MANGTIEFFTSESPFTFADWTYQQPGGKRRSKNYVSEPGSDGDEIAHATHNHREEGAWTYLLSGSVTPGTDITIPNVGQIAAGWHLDRVEIGWSREQMRPKLTASAHRHLDGNAHGGAAAHECRQYAASVAIKAVAFGVPADLGGVKLASGAVVDWRDATYVLECNHVDEAGRDGSELAGDNYDGTESISANITGNWTDDDLEAASDWTRTGDSATPSNTGATTGAVEYVHHVPHVTQQAAED